MAVSNADRSREPFSLFLIWVLVSVLREPSNVILGSSHHKPLLRRSDQGGNIHVPISVLKVTRWAFSRILFTLRPPFRISKNAVGRNPCRDPEIDLQVPRTETTLTCATCPGGLWYVNRYWAPGETPKVPVITGIWSFSCLWYQMLNSHNNRANEIL